MTASNKTKPQHEAGEWPNTVRNQAELDSALEEGEKSGSSPHNIRDIAKRTLTRLKNG